jgi:Ni/Co efflux regulator RcnB
MNVQALILDLMLTPGNVLPFPPLSLHNRIGVHTMKKTMIALAIGAAALMGGSAANAAGADAAKSTTAKPAAGINQSTDISAQRRHHHGHRHRHIHRHHGFHRHGHYRAYRPHYYNSYGYYGRPHGYYGGGPGITFSFGSGGYRGW